MIWSFRLPRPPPIYLELRVDQRPYPQALFISQPSRGLTEVNRETFSETLRHSSLLQPGNRMKFGPGKTPLCFDASIDVPYVTWRLCKCANYWQINQLFQRLFQALTDVGQRVRTLAVDVHFLKYTPGFKRFLPPQDQGL